MSELVNRIKMNVGIDDNGHCMCCDVSNCCSELSGACDEIESLESKLDSYKVTLEEATDENRRLSSRLYKALEFIRSRADDTYSEGSRWEEAYSLLKEIDVEKLGPFGLPEKTEKGLQTIIDESE